MGREKKERFWNEEKAVAAIEQFVKENGRFPVEKEMKQENGLPSYPKFEKEVGISIFQYGKKYHLELIKWNKAICRYSWNMEKVVAALEQFVKKNGRFPVERELKRENGLPSHQTFKKEVGISLFQYGKQHHPELVKKNKAICRYSWDMEKAVAAVEQFVKETGQFPVEREMKQENGLPSHQTFEKIVGMSIFQYGKQHHPELMNTRMVRRLYSWDTGKAVAAVEQFAKKHRRFPVESEMKQENGLPSCPTFEKKVGISVFEYGKQHHPELMKSRMAKRPYIWDTENVVAAVEKFMEKNGRFPAVQEMNPKNGLPAYQTFEKKVGVSVFQYGKQHHPELMKRRKAKHPSIWNAEKAVAAVEQFVKNHDRFPLTKEMNPRNGLPSYQTFEKKVGISVFEYGMQYSPESVKRNEPRWLLRMFSSSQKWTKETLITALEHFVEKYNRLPNREEYGSKNNLPSYNTFVRIAKTTFNDHLNEHFFGYRNQSSEPKEDAVETIVQDEPSLEMTMSF